MQWFPLEIFQFYECRRNACDQQMDMWNRGYQDQNMLQYLYRGAIKRKSINDGFTFLEEVSLGNKISMKAHGRCTAFFGRFTYNNESVRTALDKE